MAPTEILEMASNTKQTQSIRKRKHRKMGKERKRALRTHGSTPVFPIHVPEHNSDDKGETSAQS